MSNFKFSGNDLDTIFLPISASGAVSPLYPTNFIVSGVGDLQTRYAKYMPGSTAAPLTYYKSSNYGNLDLNTVFQWVNSPINNFSQIGGTVSGPIAGPGTTTITWVGGTTSGTTGSITFNISPNSYSISIVGGGAGGEKGYGGVSGTGGAGGKGGGMSAMLNFSTPFATAIGVYTYNVIVGSGGMRGSQTITVTDGITSSFIGHAINYSSPGGIVGAGKAGGDGGYGSTETTQLGTNGTNTADGRGAGGGGGSANAGGHTNTGGTTTGLGASGGAGGNIHMPTGSQPLTGANGRGSGGGGGGGGGAVMDAKGGSGSDGTSGEIILTVSYT